MAAREPWLGRLSNLLNTAADPASDSVSGRSSLYTEVDRRWGVSEGSHECRITFIEIEVVGEGGEPLFAQSALSCPYPLSPTLLLRLCRVSQLLQELFTGVIRLHVPNFVFNSGGIPCNRAHAFGNQHPQHDTNYKTTGRRRHILYKLLTYVYFFNLKW